MEHTNKKHNLPNIDSTMSNIIQPSAFYEQNFITQTSPKSSKEIYEIEENTKKTYIGPDTPKKTCMLVKNFTMSNSSSVSSPSSTNSNGLGYNLSEEGHLVINFKPDDYVNLSGSLLSFEQMKKVRRYSYPELSIGTEEYPFWDDYPSSKCTVAVTNHGGLRDSSRGLHVAIGGEAQFGWLDREEKTSDGAQELGRLEAINNKRPSTGENTQVLKKQCSLPSSSATKKAAKPKCESPTSKDPQSIAAKNRRERISERLKVLQDLVPNGTKVDLVTMLEKAISYVKFLQLQVKVLATDEFWPAPGGKAPDLTQVKDAIDAILASHQRDRNSSSK